MALRQNESMAPNSPWFIKTDLHDNRKHFFLSRRKIGSFLPKCFFFFLIWHFNWHIHPSHSSYMFRLKIQLKLTWAKTVPEITGHRLMRVSPASSDIRWKENLFCKFLWQNDQRCKLLRCLKRPGSVILFRLH